MLSVVYGVVGVTVSTSLPPPLQCVCPSAIFSIGCHGLTRRAYILPYLIHTRRRRAEQASTTSAQQQVRLGAADVAVRGLSVMGDAGVVNSHVLSFR